MIRRPPSPTRTHNLFPSPTLFRSPQVASRSSSNHVNVTSCFFRCLPAPALASTTRLQTVSSKTLATSQFFKEPQTRLNARDRKSTRLLQSLMRTSYAVFCLKKKIQITYAYYLTLSYNQSTTE